MKMKQKDLYQGKLVKLDPKNFFDFIDTSPVGVVMSWRGKEVEVVFSDGTRDQVWLWSLIDPYKQDKSN